MKIRELPGWAVWTGSDQGADKLATGEVGTLVRVEWIDVNLRLVTDFDGHATARLAVPLDQRQAVETLLREHVGNTIAEIGGLDMPES